jgi:hypothetical protein
MRGVFLAALAVLLNFHPARIVTAILFGRVISLFAIVACKGDHWADIFLFRGHAFSMQSKELTDAPSFP